MLQQTTVLQWPMCQEFFSAPDFRDNSALCGSAELYRRYGDSAYAVADSYLDRLAVGDPEWFSWAIGLQELLKGPEVDFEVLRSSSNESLMII